MLNETSMRYQAILDKLNRLPVFRWLITVALLCLFLFRVFYSHGWYIICYGLGIYLLNLFIIFLTPQVDPDEEGETDLPLSDEPKPFIRKLPEFKFWYAATRSVVISIGLTITRMFDIPVYWPILLGYFLILFFFTMKQRIQHMIKYKYIPFTVGKKTFN
jgi:membrane protein YdbS with pleckstrin-like domain